MPILCERAFTKSAGFFNNVKMNNVEKCKISILGYHLHQNVIKFELESIYFFNSSNLFKASMVNI